MLEPLLERFRRHDRLALSRLLTHLANGESVSEILAALPPAIGSAQVVAVTGSAGVGKSTLIGKMIDGFRRAGRTVAVLACDPQSPVTGGALLGDRFRMPSGPDEGIYIRSLATAGGLEALARHAAPMARVLETFGFDCILIETVGAGQGDTAVRGLADVVVLLLQPETGDDLQWEKAGIMEVADVIVVQKADLPGAEAVEKQVRQALELSASGVVPVLRVSAKTGAGVEALCAAVLSHKGRHAGAAQPQERLVLEAQRSLALWFDQGLHDGQPEFAELLRRWQAGALTGAEATLELFGLLMAGRARPR